MFSLRNNTFKSELFNEKTFYKRFLKDLSCSKKEVVIESPYITSSRMETLYPVFQGLLHKNIKIHLITRDPVDHDDEYFRHQSTNEILKCKELWINIVLLRGFHHRKLAIIDKQILWEGSLNILSYSNSLEIMRRIEGISYAKEMFKFLGLKNLI
ncbi:hypothetical protein GW755_02505 [bacterium]|nr:hypothetical protein [bacterium]